MNIANEKYKITQDYQYQDNDWWSWQIWIDAADKALDKINYVEYTLHSTFKNPVRKVNDRSSKFMLKEEGWGAFTVYAKIILNNGSTVLLEHDLQLVYPDGEKLEEHKERESTIISETEQEPKLKTVAKIKFPFKIILSLLVLAAIIFTFSLKINNDSANVNVGDEIVDSTMPLEDLTVEYNSGSEAVDTTTTALPPDYYDQPNAMQIDPQDANSYGGVIKPLRENSNKVKNPSSINYINDMYLLYIVDSFKKEIKKKDEEVASLHRQLDSLKQINLETNK